MSFSFFPSLTFQNICDANKMLFAYSDLIFALATPEEHKSNNLFVKRELVSMK